MSNAKSKVKSNAFKCLINVHESYLIPIIHMLICLHYVSCFNKIIIKHITILQHVQCLKKKKEEMNSNF